MPDYGIRKDTNDGRGQSKPAIHAHITVDKIPSTIQVIFDPFKTKGAKAAYVRYHNDRSGKAEHLSIEKIRTEKKTRKIITALIVGLYVDKLLRVKQDEFLEVPSEAEYYCELP